MHLLYLLNKEHNKIVVSKYKLMKYLYVTNKAYIEIVDEELFDTDKEPFIASASGPFVSNVKYHFIGCDIFPV